MRRVICRAAVRCGGALLAVVLVGAVIQAGDKAMDANTVLLWPDVPELSSPAKMGKAQRRGDKTRVYDVKTPHLKVFPGPKSAAPTPAVILVPGGGYGKLVPSVHWPIQKWFHEQGVRAFILMYRCPAGKADKGTLQDIQQAMKIVRARAKEWNVDPKRVGLLGTSAGGHLSVRASVGYKDASTKPDFTVLLYPAYLRHRGTGKLGDWCRIPRDIAPTFLTAAKDDTKHFPNSPAYEEALKKAGASVSSLYFETGGHSFTVGKPDSVSAWSDTCRAWLKEIGILR